MVEVWLMHWVEDVSIDPVVLNMEVDILAHPEICSMVNDCVLNLVVELNSLSSVKTLCSRRNPSINQCSIPTF